jgi:hypothetical protein
LTEEAIFLEKVIIFDTYGGLSKLENTATKARTQMPDFSLMADRSSKSIAVSGKPAEPRIGMSMSVLLPDGV